MATPTPFDDLDGPVQSVIDLEANRIKIEAENAERILSTTRQRARELLLEDAKKEYPHIIASIPLFHDDKTQETIKSLEKKVVHVDPIATAIGKSFSMQSKQILLEQGLYQGINIDLSGKFGHTDKFTKIKRPHAPAEFHNSISFMPSISHHQGTDPKDETLFVSLGSEYSTTSPLPDLSTNVNYSFIKFHELAHASDNKFLPSRPESTLESDLYLVSILDINNPEYCAGVALTQKAEGYADIKSLGTLLRNGQPLTIIDDVIKYREQSIDFGHNTTPILHGFKDEIESIGIDTLKIKTAAELEEIYTGVVSTYGATRRVVYMAGVKKTNEVFLKYNDCPHDVAFDISGFTPQELDNLNLVSAQLDRISDIPQDEIGKLYSTNNELDTTHLTSEDITELENYNVVDELKQNAFELDNKITPVSLAIAFANKMKELEESKGQEPEKVELINHKMAITQSCFEHTVKNTDYIQENRDRRIELFEFSNGDITLKTSPTPQAPSISPNAPKTPSR